jgi:MYXO-CTERM domain-containing protein
MDEVDELDETNNDFTAPFEVHAASGRLGFVSPPRVVAADDCSPAIRVEVQDLSGTPKAPAADLRVTLFRHGSMYLYSDPYCTQETDFTVIDAASNVGTFYLSYECGGAKTVVAAAPELASASQTELVTEHPYDGETYLEVTYTQRSKKVVVGQAVELELKVTVVSEAPLEGVMLRPEHVGLDTLRVDGVPVAVDGTVVVGDMEAGDQRTFVIEVVPEVGRLSASTMVVTAFQVADTSSVYEVASPEVELLVAGRNQGLAECSSVDGGGPGTLLLVVFGMLFLRRRGPLG